MDQRPRKRGGSIAQQRCESSVPCEMPVRAGTPSALAEGVQRTRRKGMQGERRRAPTTNTTWSAAAAAHEEQQRGQ